MFAVSCSYSYFPQISLFIWVPTCKLAADLANISFAPLGFSVACTQLNPTFRPVQM